MAPPTQAQIERVFSSGEQRFLRKLVVLGFLLRAALALVLELTGASQRLAPDEETYEFHGWQMALYWAGEILIRPWRFSTPEPHGYFYLNAAAYSLFGRTDIPLKLLNALLGALCAHLVYRIANELYGEGVARRATMFYVFFPSLILWSVLNIRDIWVIALLLFVSWNSIKVVRGYSHLALLSVIAGALALTTFRDYLFVVVAIPPVVGFVIGRRGHLERNFALGLIAGLTFLFLIQQGIVGSHAQRHLSLEALSKVRQDMATGGSALERDVDISTPARALAYLPIGISYFLFSPFPWQITSLLKAIAAPEMLVLYWLTPSTLRGIRFTLRERFRDALQVLMLTGLLTVSYALGEGNVGTLYRHRAQVLPFYLMFAAAGLELRRAAAAQKAAA